MTAPLFVSRRDTVHAKPQRARPSPGGRITASGMIDYFFIESFDMLSLDM